MTQEKCPICGKEQGSNTGNRCVYCKNYFPRDSSEEKEILEAKTIDSKTASFFVNHEQGRAAIGALRFFAWISLVAGILGAVSIWAFYATIEIPYAHARGTYTEVNPVGIAIGIAVFLQGAFLCSFFLVIAYMAENLGFLTKRFEYTVID